jgi:hypothetical protein
VRDVPISGPKILLNFFEEKRDETRNPIGSTARAASIWV